MSVRLIPTRVGHRLVETVGCGLGAPHLVDQLLEHLALIS